MNFTPSLSGEICIIGSLNIDLIIRNVSQLPRWGQEIPGGSHVLVTAGQAGYTALSLRGLDTPTRLIGNVGADLFGEQILAELGKSGIDISGCEVTHAGQTGFTVAIVRPDGERAFVTSFGCLKDFDQAMVERHWDQVQSASIVCLDGMFTLPGLPLSAAAFLLRRARQEGKITVLDTGWDPANWAASTRREMEFVLAETDIFLPNWDEASALTAASTISKAARSLQSLGPELVVIKQGDRGSFACFRESFWSLPAIPVHVFDTVGAGDNFNAGFLTALRRGWAIVDCMAFGSATAALYISRPTNRFPGSSEVLEAAQSAGWLTSIGTDY